MYTEQWDIGTALSTAMERFKSHAAGVLVPMIVGGGILFFLSLFANIAQQIPNLLTEVIDEEAVILALVFLFQAFFGVINWLVQTWIGLGMVNVYLKAARDEEPSVGDLFSIGPFYLTGLLASLVLGAAILGGVLFTWFLLFIPLIIMGIGFMMHKYLIIDQNMGPVECLKESWRITHGEKMDLFLWSLVAGLINLGGALCCLVGLIVTVPLTAIGTAWIYDNMVQRKGRADGSEAPGSSSGRSGGSYDGGFGGDASDKPAPSSRATTDGNAPLVSKD